MWQDFNSTNIQNYISFPKVSILNISTDLTAPNLKIDKFSWDVSYNVFSTGRKNPLASRSVRMNERRLRYGGWEKFVFWANLAPSQ